MLNLKCNTKKDLFLKCVWLAAILCFAAVIIATISNYLYLNVSERISVVVPLSVVIIFMAVLLGVLINTNNKHILCDYKFKITTASIVIVLLVFNIAILFLDFNPLEIKDIVFTLLNYANKFMAPEDGVYTIPYIFIYQIVNIYGICYSLVFLTLTSTIFVLPINRRVLTIDEQTENMRNTTL